MNTSDISTAHTKIKRISYALFSVSIIYIAIGVYTAFWPTTDAEVLLSVKHAGVPARNHPKGARTNAVFVSLNEVRYQYSVNGNIYQNKLLCICLPVGIDINNQMKASYFPSNPAFSVLVPGAYFDLPFVFIVIGSGLVAFAKFINKHGQGL
jgi:hypothetical protein